jgi:hypothetical protein
MTKIYNIIVYMIKMHKFFMSEGLDYVRIKGKISRNDTAYAPFAYCRFMVFSFKDIVRISCY